MSIHRYDIIWDPFPHIDFHFCRANSCYGTNLEHGFTFERAKEDIINYYKSMIEYWENISEKEWLSNGE